MIQSRTAVVCTAAPVFRSTTTVVPTSIPETPLVSGTPLHPLFFRSSFPRKYVTVSLQCIYFHDGLG